jgi:DTW domain-containing protein YfiP
MDSLRPQCARCQRPARACICHCAQPIASAVQLLVLQHPLERGHAKNTARLLHLCLPGSRLEVGEVFAEDDLQVWLHAPPASAVGLPLHPILLYPQTPPDPQLPLQPAPPLPPTWLQQPERLRLVLIDGTWRKSRKMLYGNPALQRIPRLALQDVPPGGYRIRKAHAADQLSSFEAGALALAQLQGWSEDNPAWQQLQHSFEALMQQHQRLQAMGSNVQPGDGPERTAA